MLSVQKYMDFEEDGRFKHWDYYARKIKTTDSGTFEYLRTILKFEQR